MRRQADDPRLGAYWVQYEPANLVDWGVVRVPQTFTAGFLDEPLRVIIEIELEEGGPECVAISRLDYDAPPLTSGRRFPLRAMVNAAVRAAAFELVDVPVDQVDPDRQNPRLVPDEHGRVRVYAPAFAGSSTAGSTAAAEAGATPDVDAVAALYRRAVAAGDAPSTAIAAEYGLTPAAARKWVQRARAAGALGPAVGRRAGEGEASRRVRGSR